MSQGFRVYGFIPILCSLIQWLLTLKTLNVNFHKVVGRYRCVTQVWANYSRRPYAAR